MRESTLALAFVLAAAACSGGDPRSSEGASGTFPVPGVVATPAQREAFAALQGDTQKAWTWVQHEARRTPLHLSAERIGAPLLVTGADAVRTTTGFVARYRELFRMHDPELELAPTIASTDELAMTHVRLQQVVRGLAVVGAEVSAHYDPAGRLASIDSSYVPDLHDLDLEPTITERQAAEIARAAAAAEAREDAARAAVVSTGALVVFAPPERESAAALAYQYTVRVVDPAAGIAPAVWLTTVDAKTGAILERYDRVQSVEGAATGTLGTPRTIQVSVGASGYVLVDASRGAPIRTYTSQNQQATAAEGTPLVTSSSLTSWDQVAVAPGAAVDAHYFAGLVYDYYKGHHQRNGIDGAGGAMVSNAHFASGFDNALWDGTQMIYGDGGKVFKPLAGGLDVVAHEFTHGVTQATAGLTNKGQAGALNESVSDIMAAFLEHSVAPDPTKNWQVGEAVTKSGVPIRDMTNPAAGNQPAHMTQYVNTTQDNGGVHINNGIPNNAAFLMTMGGTNPVSKVELTGGIGWDKAEKLWYRADTKYFMQTTTFAQAAQATMQAAKDLQFTDAELNIVDCAWKAVGVVQGSCTGAVATQSTTPGVSSGGAAASASAPDGDAAAAAPGGAAAPVPNAPSTKRRSPGGGLDAQDANGCSVAAPGAPAEGALGVVLAAVALVVGRVRRKR